MIECRGIWLPDHEAHLQPHILGNPIVDGAGTYQYAKLELAMAHVRQFRVAVDVGCHVGLWARILASHFDHVEAFEPMPSHLDCFAKNVTAENVVLHECALGAAAGEVRMTTYAGNSGHSHVAELGDIKVPIRTLDSFGFDALDFIKIDTEGYEVNVLRGAIDTLIRCKPAIIVEQKADNGSRYGYDDRAALPFLKALGARVVAEKARDYVLAWER